MSYTKLTSTFEFDYTVAISGASGGLTTTENFTLEVWNPCVDSAFNQILVPADYTITHEVSEATQVIGDYTEDVSVTLSSLCGSTVNYSVSTTTEVTEDAVLPVLSIYANDVTLVGTSQEIVVQTELALYPAGTGVQTWPAYTITVDFVTC